MRLGFLLASMVALHAAVVHVPIAASEPSRNGHERRLHELFRKEWDYRLEQFPVFASSLGDKRWNRQWDDVRLSAYAARSNHFRGTLSALGRIQRGKLRESDRVHFDLFRKDILLELEELHHRWYLIPLNQREGIQTADLLADDLRFEVEQDYGDWIARLRNFGDYMDQTLELLHEGIRVRRVLSKVIARRLQPQISKQIVDDPSRSPFYKPLLAMPASVPESRQQQIRQEAQQAIRESIVPAFQRLSQFFTVNYLPACLEKEGIWQMPDGDALYSFFARKFTTTDLTPDQIHELGLSEVQRIRGEMEAIRVRVGFQGNLNEFFHYLRTDSRFFLKDPKQLLAAYQAASKKVDPLLVKLFRTLPRIPYGVEPIPEKIAPDTTTAYYRPPAADGSRAGYYSVNLYRPETRPLHEIMALTLHEAVPGHHLQIALSMEQGDLPHFRRYGGYTAFVEGWALYAESLGDELGLYEDPYDKMGQLTYEMWRAVRLVVDTGIHAKRWTRQQAIDYFTAQAPKSELDIANEIDRYIAWPGQALAYKMGELKIKELRALAARELGAKFDLKAFHDVVLLAGAVPLDLLETRVRDWIRRQ